MILYALGFTICWHCEVVQLQSIGPVVCQQARALAEFDGARSDLMTHLLAELPSKDLLDGPQPGVAPPEDVVAPLTEDQLVESLVGLPWEFIINKDARQEWAWMDRPFRSDLLTNTAMQCSATLP